jgi:hypothetical protein
MAHCSPYLQGHSDPMSATEHKNLILDSMLKLHINSGGAREAFVAKGGQPVPVVMCPGCKKAMLLRLLEPASGNLETATFYCEQCGTETKREFVRDKKR